MFLSKTDKRTMRQAVSQVVLLKYVSQKLSAIRTKPPTGKQERKWELTMNPIYFVKTS